MLQAELGYKQAICKVQNNRIVELYNNTDIFDLKSGFIFHKMKIEVSSSITNCKASFRIANENEYSTVYFLDNILDSSRQIEDPYFAFYTIYTNKSNLNDFLHVEIARDYNMSRDEIQNFRAGPYHINAQEYNPPSNDCKNSMITLAIKRTNSLFSIGIVRLSDKKTWIFYDLSFNPSSCNSTILSD
jgi:hypothetical protein